MRKPSKTRANVSRSNVLTAAALRCAKGGVLERDDELLTAVLERDDQLRDG
jgi:hypothetical protein